MRFVDEIVKTVVTSMTTAIQHAIYWDTKVIPAFLLL